MGDSPETPTALKATRLALDSYDDIFSDFDISPYSKRLLSYDFLKELRRGSAETKTGALTVSLTLPGKKRSKKTEALIRKRLKDHFRHNLEKLEMRVGRSRKKGVLKLLVGLAASIVAFSFLETALLTTLVSVFSWYFMWAGYTDIFESADKNSARMNFYKKFIEAKYEFFDEEHYLKSICGQATLAGSTPKGSS